MQVELKADPAATGRSAMTDRSIDAVIARLALARTVVERLLSTRNAEAKALTLLEVAQNNYADHRAELAEYEKASVAASQAEADARALLKAMEVPHE